MVDGVIESTGLSFEHITNGLYVDPDDCKLTNHLCDDVYVIFDDIIDGGSTLLNTIDLIREEDEDGDREILAIVTHGVFNDGRGSVWDKINDKLRSQEAKLIISSSIEHTKCVDKCIDNYSNILRLPIKMSNKKETTYW